MAAEGVQPEQNRVHDQDNGAQPYTELCSRTVGTVEPESLPGIVGQKEDEDDRKIQKIAVRILNQQRPLALAPVGLARLAHSAGNRIGPEALVVSTAIVVAGKAESEWRPQDEPRCRIRDQGRPPRGSIAE